MERKTKVEVLSTVDEPRTLPNTVDVSTLTFVIKLSNHIFFSYYVK